MTGTIKKLLNGFGFIEQEGGKGDIFFHASELKGVSFDELKGDDANGNKGDAVTYEVAPGKEGKPSAVNVSRA